MSGHTAMTKHIKPDYNKLLDPIKDVTTSVEAMLDGAFGPLMGDQREDLKRIYSSAWGLHTLFMDIITSIGLENIANRTYLQDKFNGVLDPLIHNCTVLTAGTDGPLTAEQTVCVDYMLETGHLLRGYIGKLWLYSQVLHQRLPIKPQSFDLTDAIPSLEFAESIEDVHLEWHIPDDLPCVRGDMTAIRIIIREVVSNAIYFTRRGSVRVSAQAAGDHDIRVQVKDSGGGIAPEHQSRIFDPFFQAHTAVHGIGLGLTIARHLVTQQSGHIHLQRTGRDGSLFVLQFPSR